MEHDPAAIVIRKRPMNMAEIDIGNPIGQRLAIVFQAAEDCLAAAATAIQHIAHTMQIGVHHALVGRVEPRAFLSFGPAVLAAEWFYRPETQGQVAVTCDGYQKKFGTSAASMSR